jgi:hypothetical protein
MHDHSRFIGTSIDGKYKILSLLGEGGLGLVFKAEQAQLSRFVAIKFLRCNSDLLAESLARFIREARILAGFDHQHIVGIYSTGILDDRQPYLVMEYLEGRTLFDVLQSDSPADCTRTLAITIQVCQALQYAHKQGVIHRDLKPQNIMLLAAPTSDFVKVLDFGLSRLLVAEADLEQRLTRTGALLGSAHYLPPELCRGQKADERSDIYSLGCILYECLAGRTPFNAETPLALLHKQLAEMPQSLPATIPEPLQRVTFKAIQKDPQDRFQSMSDFEEALSLIRSGREDEINITKIKLGRDPDPHQVGVTAKALSLIGIMILLLTATAVFLTSKMKEEVHLKVKRGKAPEVRREQIRRARNFALEASNHFSQGHRLLAEEQAQRALLAIAQPFSRDAGSKEFAADDLAILKLLSPVYKNNKWPDTVTVSSIDSRIRTIDENYLDQKQRAELNLYLADIACGLGSFYDFLEDTYKALNCYASLRQFEHCRELMTSIEKLPVKDEDLEQARAIYLGLANMRLLFAEGESKKAHDLANKLVGQVNLNVRDTFRKYQLFFELADFQTNYGDLEAAADCFSKAKAAGADMTGPHPEAYSESIYHLTLRLRSLKRYAEAEAQIKELKAYQAQLNNQSLKKRLAGYLKTLKEFRQPDSST